LIELVQVRRRHDDTAHHGGLVRRLQGGRRGRSRATPHAQQDGLHVIARFATARLDHALHLVDGVFVQQLQNANVVLDAAAGAMLVLQGFAEIAKDRRQAPAAKDVGVIERRRSVLQGAEVVVWIEDLLMFAV